MEFPQLLHIPQNHIKKPIEKIVLASASPRRVQLLRALDLPFIQAPLKIAEPTPQIDDQTHPAAFVERLAKYKADHCPVPDKLPRPLVVLAADTTVWHNGKIFTKPRDTADATRMLRILRGEYHQVFTGICLKVLLEDNSIGKVLLEHEVTDVHFTNVSDSWIESYVASGEPLDKAGSYDVRNRGASLVARIEGDFWNVVGLPLSKLSHMLKSIDAPVEYWWNKNISLGESGSI